ncbi:MAG TPA: alpha/beta fold hydrolase [Caulobacteraceae bacterium]|nr:alpha/beta fold hydrolase [Caulobacteraceae bacterium]
MQPERIRYAKSADGTSIAWAESGVGPRTLVLAANHITDIKGAWDEPARGGALRRLGEHFRVIRYDNRGCGSSQRSVERQGQQAWVEDLAAVVAAAQVRAPFVMVAFSQSGPCAAQFAAEHADLLSHLIFYGVYSKGAALSDLPNTRVRREALVDMVRADWGAQFHGARMLVTANLILDPTPEEQAWFDRIWPLAATPEAAARFLAADAYVDARPYLPVIRTPTLVFHAEHDTCVPPELGREFAAAIRGAEYVELPGRNHILLERDLGFEPFCRRLLEFTGEANRVAGPIDSLSAREREILDGVCAGLSNEAIALQRNISVSTVRNHLTRVFDKLGVMSRTQAAIAMREHVR